MGKTKNIISIADRARIVEHAYSKTVTLSDIAKKFPVSRASVRNLAKKFEGIGSVKDLAKSGRPRIITSRDARRITNVIKVDGVCTASKAAEIFNKDNSNPVSESTMLRSIKSLGFTKKRKFKKSFLSERHRILLQWARARKAWTVDDWKRVMFTDEAKIELHRTVSGHFGGQKGEKISPRMVIGTFNFGSGGIMVWVSMGSGKVGNLCGINVTMGSEVCVEILDNRGRESYQYLFNNSGNFILQQDSDPKHTSRFTRVYLERNTLNVMDRPPQSPDLNPIENLWHILKERVHKDHTLKSLNELWKRIEEEWWGIENDIVSNLIASMPSRVQQVIEQGEGWINY